MKFPLVVVVPGEVVPTARVRSTGRHTATPRSTVEYQSRATLATLAAMRGQGWVAPERARVLVQLFTAREDCDGENVVKGLVDALVKAGALHDDRLKYLRGESWEAFDPDPAPEARVYVYSLDTESRCL
jgi:Holliday junction resolvase RusA-like endonuclease